MKGEAVNQLNTLAPTDKKKLALAMLMKALSFIGQVGCFWYFSIFMQQYIVAHQALTPVQLYAFTGFGVLWLVCRHVAAAIMLTLKNTLESTLQQQINDLLMSQKHALAKRHSSFFWQQVYLQYIPAIAQFNSVYTYQKYISVVLPCLVVIAIAPINWFVAVILVCTLPVVPMFMVLVGHSAAKLHRKHFSSLERLGGLFIDRLKALTLLTIFNQHKTEASRLANASRLVNKQTMRVVSLAFLSSTVLDFFSTISIALVAVYIGFSLLGELALGPMIAFEQGLFLLLITPLIFTELKILGSLYHQKGEAEAAIEALLPIINAPVNHNATGEFSAFKADNFEIMTPAVTAKNLMINPYDAILFTGHSGAGKSVTLDGLMGLTLASHSISGRCVLFTQQANFLQGSVRDNLLMGQTLADERLWEMLEQVQLKEKIKALPEQLDTYLSDNISFSGGEAQRLALARVLLQTYDVILLDEPTAHLTEEDHYQLAELIHKLTQGKTKIWASHKPLPIHWFTQQWHISGGKITCT